MRKMLIVAAVAVFALPAMAQQPSPQMSPTETIDALRSIVDTYKALKNEADERVASVKAERDMLTAKNKALQAELDKFKAEKAKADEPPKAPDPK